MVQSMLSLSETQLKKYRGKDIAMVMQQGSRAFDPSTTVGKQMFETMKVHTSMSTQEIEKTLIEYMDYLSLKDPKTYIKIIPLHVIRRNVTAIDDCFSVSFETKVNHC